MRPVQALSIFCVVSLLISCEKTPVARDNTDNPTVHEFVKHTQQWLPGVYSNYAQVNEEGSDRAVTDLNIRQLITSGEPVYLFESTQRESDVSNHEIYWLKTNRNTQEPEFHFTYLKEDELSLPMKEILTLAWSRVDPGCKIELTQSENTLKGKTNPETCLFDHLLQGETKLNRSIALAAETLEIKNELLIADYKVSPENTLKLQKHRNFEGWASSRTPAGPEQEQAGEWKLSSIMNIRDDGQINDIRDQQMKSIGFGLQLAKLKRHENEPPYMLLSIINMEVGGIQAYTWFAPESESFELNLDWFQTDLRLKQAEVPANAN